MMDCDTTGIEPDIALIKYKKLVGEGYLKIVNQTVPAALRKLGYTPGRRSRRSSPTSTSARPSRARRASSREHLPVFDCAFKPMNGERSIHYMGHIRMMGAVQPFLSGAISKTVNMPENATAEEIETVYLEGWKLGLKAIAIYRDGSKRSQPLSHRQEEGRGLGRGQGDHRGPAPAARVGPGRGHPPAPPPPPDRADRGHPQVRDHRPRGLHHRRPLPGRPARRDLPHDGQGRLHDQRPDGHARRRRSAWRSSTACRCGTWSTSSPTCGSSPAASPATRRSRSPSRLVDYIFRWMGSRFLPERGEGRPRADRPLRGGRRGPGRVRRVGPAAARGRGHHRPVRGDRARRRPSRRRPPPRHRLRRRPPPTTSPRPSGARGPVDQRLGGHARARDGRRATAPRNGGSTAANGNGNGKRTLELVHRLPRRRREGRVRGPGRRPVLRRVRLDHGPQRQLLQVPQLREHQRLQLILARAPDHRSPGRSVRGFGSSRAGRRSDRRPGVESSSPVGMSMRSTWRSRSGAVSRRPRWRSDWAGCST